MKQFLSFVRKEFIHILRDPRSLLILLVMPQIMVLLPGYVIKNEVKDIRVAVLDRSHDVYTDQITQRLYANDYFIGKGEIKSEQEATKMFRKGEIDLVVVFDPSLPTVLSTPKMLPYRFSLTAASLIRPVCAWHTPNRWWQAFRKS